LENLKSLKFVLKGYAISDPRYCQPVSIPTKNRNPKALANRKMCEDLHLMEKLALFEKDRKEAVEER